MAPLRRRRGPAHLRREPRRVCRPLWHGRTDLNDLDLLMALSAELLILLLVLVAATVS
jgi:hypothetical protein